MNATDWPRTTIRSLEDSALLELRSGFARGAHNEEGRGVPHVRPFNVTEDGRIDFAKVKYIEPPSLDSPHWLRAGDVIFNNTNSEELTGKTALFESDVRCVPSNHITVLRGTSDQSPDGYWLAAHLRYLWATGFFRKLLRRYVGQASVSLTRLRDVELPLPPLPEQRAIAHMLRAVQRAKERTEQVIAAAQELKKSLMRHLFNYGPVPVSETESVVLKESEVGDIPGHWEVTLLGEIADTSSGGTPRRDDPSLYGPGYPWLKSGELGDGLIDRAEESITDEGLSSSNTRLHPPGTLLMAMYGATAGVLGMLGVEAATNQAVCAIEPDPNRARSDYLFRALAHNRPRLLAERHGGAQPNLSQRSIRRFPLAVPPLWEQSEIVGYLAPLDHKIAAEAARRDALATLSDSLLRDLMSARLRVVHLEVPE